MSMHDVTPIQIRFQTDELAAIDSYRRAKLNPPTRPQAIRELLRQVLRQTADCAGTKARA
jgi:dihydroorotase-like cyclic amidohydrolase